MIHECVPDPLLVGQLVVSQRRRDRVQRIGGQFLGAFLRQQVQVEIEDLLGHRRLLLRSRMLLHLQHPFHQTADLVQFLAEALPRSLHRRGRGRGRGRFHVPEHRLGHAPGLLASRLVSQRRAGRFDGGCR